MLSLITAAVVGVVLNLAVYLGRAVLFPTGHFAISGVHWPSLAWLLVSLVALHRFKVNMILWIGVSAGVGLLYYLLTTFAG